MLEDAASAFSKVQGLYRHGAYPFDHDVEYAVVFQKDGGSARSAQKRAQLRENPLFRQRFQKRCVLAQCVFRSALDGKIQFCREAKGPHDAKGVFGEAVEGVADCAKATLPDVVKPPEGVEDASRRMEGHGVHAKIAPREVVFDAIGERYGIGVPRIAVDSVDAVGRYLERDGFDHDGYRAVFHACLNNLMTGFLEKGACLLPRSRSGYVVVVRLGSHERIADAPSDEPGAVASPL